MATRARVSGTRAARRADPAPDGPSLAYEPALDGLRAVAVLAVLLYHGGATWMRGGFLGVDLFFVLSGYLNTTLLLVEWGRTGNLSLKRFWLRRARRLLPALALVLVGIALYAVAVAQARELKSIRDDALSSIGYVANWRFILSNQSYFEQFATPSPFRHMWSLAIEEQFYLMWPFIVLGLLRWRPQLRFLSQLFAGAALVSAVLMAVLYRSGSDPSRVYYGTDTRAQALLVGAALAALLFRVLRTPHTERRPTAPWVRAGLAGSIVLLVTLIAVRDASTWMYRGGYLLVAIACAAVIAAAVQPRRNLVRAALSPMPLRAVGKISYGLYLWHWPVYLTLTEDRAGLDRTALLVTRMFASAALAAASYFFVEVPIRHGRWPTISRRALLAVPALAAVLVIVFVLVPVVRGDGQSEVAVAGPTATTAAPGTVPASVLLVGDSAAKTLGDGFDRAANDLGVKMFNRAQLGCGLAQRATLEHGGVSAPTEPTCDDWPQKWRGYVEETSPAAAVVLFDVFVLQDLEVDGKDLPFNTKASDRYLLKQLEKGVEILRSAVPEVVLLTAPYNQRPQTAGQPSRWDEDNPARVNHWNDLLRQFAASRADIVVIDLNKFLSPDGKYTNTKDGVELRYDGVHFNPDAGVLVFQWLLPQLLSASD